MPEPETLPVRVSEPLYDAVALGMWMYTRAAFRVVELGAERYRPRPGLLLVSSHRAETDVPLICPSLYSKGRYWQRQNPRVHFAARDDMFDRGFFAGFPPRLPIVARRLLYPIQAGPFLPLVRVNPVPYPGASLLRLGKALSQLPAETPLEHVLPPQLLECFASRAHAVGARPPRTAAETLRGTYADLLWRFCTPEELANPVFDLVWRRRAEEATAAIRRLIELVGAGKMLLLFPEGRPSAGGAIGPLRKGLATIVRRGAPEAIAPIAIAYDHLTRGRPRAYVAFGEELAPRAGVEAAVLAALKQTTPLTCGQVVASELVRCAEAASERIAVGELDTLLADECANAAAATRPVDRALLDASSRRHLLTEALTWCVRAGLAAPADRRTLVLAPARILANPALRRAVTEYASARE